MQIEKNSASTSPDTINPAHYKSTYPFEVIELIKQMLTPEQFVGFCLGNELKYRMRAGVKHQDTLVEDIKKAEWYNNERVKFIYESN